MDKSVQKAQMIAQRMVAGRKMAELTTKEVADATPLAMADLEAIERGDLLPTSRDIAFMASATGLPIAWFLEDRQPLVASRKADAEGGTSPDFDVHLERISLIVEQLAKKGVVRAKPRKIFELPLGDQQDVNHDYAAAVARKVRDFGGVGEEPINNLSEFCEEFGLLAFAKDFVGAPFEGALTEVIVGGMDPIGIALIAKQPGSIRPRFTLAHELGHWMFDTTFKDGCGHATTERYMNSFAAHLLMPAAYVRKLAAERPGRDARQLAIAVSAICRVSWKATLGHLEHLDLISAEAYALQVRDKPRPDEFRAHGFDISSEEVLDPVPPGYRENVIDAYSRRMISEGKALDALFGAVFVEELPERDRVRQGIAYSWSR